MFHLIVDRILRQDTGDPGGAHLQILEIAFAREIEFGRGERNDGDIEIQITESPLNNPQFRRKDEIPRLTPFSTSPTTLLTRRVRLLISVPLS